MRYRSALTLKNLAVFSLAAFLVACGGESNTLPAGVSGVTISGTAATGAPIVGANVSTKCKNGNTYPAPGAVTTSVNGSYTGIVVPTNAFPCVVQSTGGTSNGATAPTLHSFVSSSANTKANITPLTDLVTALALKNGADLSDLSAWFTSAEGSATLELVASSLSTAQTELLSALALKGFSTTGISAPFTGNITPAIPPSTNTDPYDNLLEDIQASLASASSTYAALLSGLVTACTTSNCNALTLSGSVPAPVEEEPTDPTDPEEPTSELGNQSGVTLLADGVRYTTTHIQSYVGGPLSVGTGYLDAGQQNDPFRVNISGIMALANYSANCQNNGIPNVTVTLHGHDYQGSPNQGGYCTVKTVSIDTTRIVVNFSGQLKRSTESETAPEYINVTDGKFQYIVETFGAGNDSALVNASFEGAAAGGYYQNNPLPISVGDFGWKESWTNVTTANVSSSPLQVTPTGGDVLSGGDVAISWLGEHKFAKVFSGDVYVSFLIRWPTPQPGKGLVANQILALSNLAAYVGVHNNKFFASMGDTTDKKFESAIDVVAGTTYHVVGRMKKTAGSGDYNEMTLWVNPARHGEASPTGTATHPTMGTGAMRYVDKLSLYSGGGNNSPDPVVDRIRLSDTWEGLFAE